MTAIFAVSESPFSSEARTKISSEQRGLAVPRGGFIVAECATGLPCSSGLSRCWTDVIDGLYVVEKNAPPASPISWSKVFEANRRAVLSASMMAVRGRIQREGDVVHLLAQRITDLSADVASGGSREAAFPLPHGRGDQVRNGGSGPDPRELPPKGLRTRDI